MFIFIFYFYIIYTTETLFYNVFKHCDIFWYTYFNSFYYNVKIFYFICLRIILYDYIKDFFIFDNKLLNYNVEGHEDGIVELGLLHGWMDYYKR